MTYDGELSHPDQYQANYKHVRKEAHCSLVNSYEQTGELVIIAYPTHICT